MAGKGRVRPLCGRDECQAFALAERLEDGVWGGLSATERRHLRLAG